MRHKINETLTRRRLREEALRDTNDKFGFASIERDDLNNMLTIARKAAGIVQDSLATKVSGIVTRALSTVFERPITFVAEFVERRNVSECDLYVKEGDHVYDILRSRGGGLADVCSLCLQMAFIIMSGKRRVLFADEIARHVGRPADERFAEILSQLCRELDFTIVTVTHSAALAEAADRVFLVTQTGGISYVERKDS